MRKGYEHARGPSVLPGQIVSVWLGLAALAAAVNEVSVVVIETASLHEIGGG